MSNTANTPRLLLSSTFTNRMVENGLVRFKEINLDLALALIDEAAANGSLVNGVNPAHGSTAILAEGVAKTPCLGGFLSMNVGDKVVVMTPHAASRNATEFTLSDLSMVKWSLAERLE